MTNYRSLVAGGFFANPDTSTANWSIRSNNPGAINGNAQWVKDSPGFVKTVVIGGGNPIAVFETPEQGLALYWNLLKRYREAGAYTVGKIINRYGGGQDYSAYVDFVSRKTGFAADKEIKLDDDATLTSFAKAMFWYEAGSPSPLKDAQFAYGWALARGQKPQEAPSAGSANGAAILAKARSYIGKYHDGPDVPQMARETAAAFPDDKELARYCLEASNDMPWCGDFIGFVLSKFGIKPPPVKNGIGHFYVDRWLDFGIPIPVGQEQDGDICLFIYPGTLHHITFVAGNGRYVGGNQSDAVTETSFRPKPTAIRRAPQPQPIVITQDKPKPNPVVPVAAGGAAAYGLHLIGAHPAWIAAAIVAGVLIGAFLWNWRKS